jgi:hypothetical protein
MLAVGVHGNRHTSVAMNAKDNVILVTDTPVMRTTSVY